MPIERPSKSEPEKWYRGADVLVGCNRNNFVAYVSGLTDLAIARNPYIILHGPLVRATAASAGTP
jgi:hypothetical protein